MLQQSLLLDPLWATAYGSGWISTCCFAGLWGSKGSGKEAKLCFIGHALIQNRNALFVDACLTKADGDAERVAALHMIEPRADRPRWITLGADKGYDAEDFVNELRSMRVTPHVPQNVNGRSYAIDRRTTRHDVAAQHNRVAHAVRPPHPRRVVHRGGDHSRPVRAVLLL